MNKLVSLINWVNGTVPAINDSNLNKMDREIDGLDDRIITLDTGKLDKTTAYEMVKSITYNESDGVFTVTYLNGTTSTLDTKLEKLAVNFEYDSSTEKLVITLSDGTKQYVDMSSLITEYNFEDSTTIDFSVTSGKVKADVIDGSITGAKLEPNYLANVTTKADAASSAATTASSKATEAKSYAVGGTGTRSGEDTDNAKYYYEQASAIVGVDIATTTTAGIVKPDGETISVLSDGTISAEVITYGADALEDGVSELTSGVMYCQVTDGNIVKAWIGIDGVAKPLSVGSTPTPTYSISAWCDTIGLEYDELSEIPSSDMSLLMGKHASADYFVEWYNADSSMLDDFLASESAMENIGKWDYICDKLFAISSAKSALLGSEKWEYILKDKVPTMTSNTTPSGTVSASTEYQSRYAYRVFDGYSDTSSYDHEWCASALPAWVQYRFENPICVNKIYQENMYSVGYNNVVKDFKIQASNDGTDWIDLFAGTNTDSTSIKGTYWSIDNTNYYLYYRMYITSSYRSGANYVAIGKLQFYGRALNVSIPTMTSNTTPKGEVSASSTYSGRPAYQAFNERTPVLNASNFATSVWMASESGVGQWLRYKFANPICAKSVEISGYQSTGKTVKFKVQGSNDGTTWVDVCDENEATFPSWSNGATMDYKLFSFDNDDYYLYYRAYFTSALYVDSNHLTAIETLQFYGVDYSEPTTVPLTLTIEGAKGDNITVTDADGEIVSNVIFDADATSKEVTIDVVSGANYTFTSSVAKATDGSGADYSKTVALSSDTTDVKLVPSGALYWYGNDVTTLDDYNYSYSGMTKVVPTRNANDIYINPNNSASFPYYYSGVVSCSPFNLADYSSAKALMNVVSADTDNNSFYLNVCTTKDLNTGTSSQIKGQSTSGNEVLTLDVSSISTDNYVIVWGIRQCKAYIKALWLEKKRDTPTSYDAVTITVEGAKEDKITVYGEDAEVVDYINFDSGETSKSVTLNIKKGGEKLKFVSQVAKDTSDSTKPYTKTVDITSSTTSVKVMPNALYWYGNECVNMSVASWKYNSNIAYVAPTLNKSYTSTTVNYASTRGSSNSSNAYMTSEKIDLTNISTFKALIYESGIVTGNAFRLAILDNLTVGGTSSYTNVENTSKAIKELDLSSASGSYYVGLYHLQTVSGTTNGYFEALWLE